MKFGKKALVLTVVLSLLISSLAGCAKPTKTPTAAEPTKAASGKKVALILATGGLGDQSFNDLTYAGMQRAEKELNVKFDYVEPKAIADYEIQQSEMASSGDYSVIVCVGFDQADALTKVATQYPDQKFAIIDMVVDKPNVASYVSEEQQASFLVGALAGLMEKDKSFDKLKGKSTAGVVGALDIPLINKFIAGFTAGAKYVNPDMKVLKDYVGDFSDPTTAKEISIAMNNKGADIIYHAAGGSGLGVFQAAKEKNFYGIGANSNQNGIEPNNIVASMLKRVDVATFDVVKKTLEGKFKPGITSLGIPEDGVGYTLEGSNVKVPESIISQVEGIKEKIKSGEIIVPDSIDKVDAFLKANKMQ